MIDTDRYIERLVDAAPPFTVAQKEHLYVLLGLPGPAEAMRRQREHIDAAAIQDYHREAVREAALRKKRAEAERALRAATALLAKTREGTEPADPAIAMADKFFAKSGGPDYRWEDAYASARAWVESQNVYARQCAEAHAEGDHWRCHFAECSKAERPSREELAEDEAECRLNGHLPTLSTTFCIRCGASSTHTELFVDNGEPEDGAR